MTSRLVDLTLEDGVATVLLNSVRNRNALSRQLLHELGEALDAVAEDDRARVLVLTHAGPVFCAGADLKESRAPRGTTATGVFEKVWDSPKPVIGRLAGPARAGGLGLLAACDLAVAADDVSFAFTEVRIGVVPAVISVLLRRRVPAAQLHELFLTGRTFGATHAVELGLLSAAVPADRLDDRVDEFVDELLHGAPGALATTKALLRPPGALSAELARMEALSRERFAAPEGVEGMRAFAEKRPPAWVTAGTTH